MRLLFLAERFPPDLGGLARSGERIAQTLARVGAKVDVLAWTKTLPPGTLETLEQDGVRLHRLGLFANTDLSQQHTLNVLDWLHAEAGFDVVWGHYVRHAGFLAVLFAELHGISSIISARGNDVDQLMFPPGDFARLQWTLGRANTITSVSEDLAHKIKVILGRDPNVRVIGNAVDIDTFSPQPASAALREQVGIHEDEAVLGFSGEVRHKKGFPFMLEALSEVRAQRPACLLVIGEMRARERAHLASYAGERPEDAARVLVSGHIDDPQSVAEHLCLCDVYWQPSVWEGLPNALLEAMACARVAIASDAGGIPEAIEHGKSGFVIPRAELHQLGGATLELLAMPAEERTRIGEQARDRVVERYCPAVEEAALAEVLETVNG